MSETSGEKDEVLLELAVHYVVSGGQYATDLSKDKKRAVRRKATVFHTKRSKNLFLHFGSYLRNQVSYDHVAGTIMILYPY